MADTPVCGHCGGEARRFLKARDRNRAVTKECFPYYRCHACGLVFLRPVPQKLQQYYPAGYHRLPASVDELLEGRQHETFKLEAIGSRGAGRRLLEIGPSSGRFAALAKQAGFRVSAIEMDATCCGFLRETLGIPAELTQDVASVLPRLGRFDVIALWHSLEHLREPWAIIDALPDHLDPEGLLAIATPNPRSRQFRLLRSRWVHLDAPRHLTLIPETVLETRLVRRGMRRVHFSTSDQGARDCNMLGWVTATYGLLPAAMRRRPFTSVLYRLSRQLAKLDEREPHGSAYTVVYQKQRRF